MLKGLGGIVMLGGVLAYLAGNPYGAIVLFAGTAIVFASTVKGEGEAQEE